MSNTRALTWIERKDCAAAIDEIELELKAVPDFSNDAYGWKARRAYIDQMTTRLEGRMGLTMETSSLAGGVVRGNGVRATSTSGIAGALQNWVTAARKRIAA